MMPRSLRLIHSRVCWKAHQSKSGHLARKPATEAAYSFLWSSLGWNLPLLLRWLGQRWCVLLFFRKEHPALRYLKQDRPLLCVLDSLGSLHALLCVLPIFFRLAHHGPSVRYPTNLAALSLFLIRTVRKSN
jgi:hypothetical protein